MVSDAEVRLDIMEWAAQVTTMLNDPNNPLQNKVTLPRVAMDLMNVKPEAYVPRYISLGPYHHRKLIKDIPAPSERHSFKMSTAEEYKVKSAATVSQNLTQPGRTFNNIVEAIEGRRLEFERFYDWKIEDDQSFRNFSLMMAVDSTFLLYFLFGLLRDQTQPAAATSIASFSSHDDTYYLSLLEGCIKCDILKLENQIPLVVLQHVFNKEKDVLPGARCRDFYDLLRKTYMAFSPFVVDNDRFESNLISNYAVTTRPHLLGCMHAFVSPFLGIQAGLVENDRNWTLFQKVGHFLAHIGPTVLSFRHPVPISKIHPNYLTGYSVKELLFAGIGFKSFSDPQQHIRLGKYSKTLYLPRITIYSIYTEVFLRNMLALEFNDPGLGNSVTGFVKLMHCLINTPKDVKMLRNFGIIRSTRLTDEDVAKMWDGMCQPFFTSDLEPPEVFKSGLHEVLATPDYIMRFRIFLSEFSWGSATSVTLYLTVWGLVFTILQTLCNFQECKNLF